MLTVKEISLVRNNFRKLSAVRDEIFIGVYERFALHEPKHDELYITSLRARANTLSTLVDIALLSMDHPDAMRGTLNQLGREYANYGTWRDTSPQLIEYTIVELAEHNGTAWTRELQDAWYKCLTLIAQGMLEGLEKDRGDVA